LPDLRRARSLLARAPSARVPREASLPFAK
jgi:hypothetical protein